MNGADDPVLARRAVIARRVGWASRVGYGALALAVVAFVTGLIAGFPTALVNLTIAGLVAACLILPITIILGYGIRAAAREDRESGGGPSA
ncbi:MAG: hypothetical protein ACRDY6_10415 [Acidimicrobiia bacterium]